MIDQSTANATAIQDVVEKLTEAWNNHDEKDLARLFRENGEFSEIRFRKCLVRTRRSA